MILWLSRVLFLSLLLFLATTVWAGRVVTRPPAIKGEARVLHAGELRRIQRAERGSRSLKGWTRVRRDGGTILWKRIQGDAGGVLSREVVLKNGLPEKQAAIHYDAGSSRQVTVTKERRGISVSVRQEGAVVAESFELPGLLWWYRTYGRNLDLHMSDREDPVYFVTGELPGAYVELAQLRAVRGRPIPVRRDGALLRLKQWAAWANLTMQGLIKPVRGAALPLGPSTGAR